MLWLDNRLCAVSKPSLQNQWLQQVPRLTTHVIKVGKRFWGQARHGDFLERKEEGRA